MVPTVQERISALRRRLPTGIGALDPPLYSSPPGSHRLRRVFFAFAGFSSHMTDEGWQLQLGLNQAGYDLVGKGFTHQATDVSAEVDRDRPSVAIVQDKREWDDQESAACLNRGLSFHNFERMASDDRVFRVTVCKDAQANPPYHRAASAELAAHAWICYYHPDMVATLAPYVRREHLVRTWHSVNPSDVPEYSPHGREMCLLSGAINAEVYPFRTRLHASVRKMPGVHFLPHPGYHARGHRTPDYLEVLSRYRVSICTASIYGYTLRKIIESTACGCRVLTDLPPDDILPEIDGNLVRISPEASVEEVYETVRKMDGEYDAERQRQFAERAVGFYDFWRRGRELASAIEELRRVYPSSQP